MSFTDDVQKLSQQVKERKQYVRSEASTKSSLINPFIRLIGYDTEDPREVVGEYSADFAKRTGGKLECVDYALFKDGKPVIFIEAKPIGEELGNHEPQLARYFNATAEVRFGILSNGIVYKFFSDLKRRNIMDSEPFFEFNFDNYLDTDLQALAKFRKAEFDVQALVKLAEELAYLSNLKCILRVMFRNPTDDFIGFLTRKIYSGKVNQRIIDRFRPLVKQSTSAVIVELVSQGVVEVISKPQEKQEPKSERLAKEPIPEAGDEKPEVVTTEEELKAFYLIKEMVSNAVPDPSVISYTDRVYYFSVHLDSPSKWFVRLRCRPRKSSIVLRISPEEAQGLAVGFTVRKYIGGSLDLAEVIISSIEDIKHLQNLLVASLRKVLESGDAPTE